MSRQEALPVAVVVNDDPGQLHILAGLLGKAGLEARPFAGVEAALAAMDPADPPELVVTDLSMPGIDGWRFCRLLRSPEYAAFNQVPILVVSADIAGDHAERMAADAGADAFLPAPVDGKAFVPQARALLLEARTRELRDSETRYRSVFAATPDGIWVHGPDGVILDANEAMARRLGVTPEALIGRNILEFITPENACTMSEHVREVSEGRSCVFETTYVSSAGAAIEAEVHEHRISWGSRQAVISISRDISNRKRAEEEKERLHPDGHLKIPQLWPPKNPPPSGWVRRPLGRTVELDGRTGRWRSFGWTRAGGFATRRPPDRFIPSLLVARQESLCTQGRPRPPSRSTGRWERPRVYLSRRDRSPARSG